ncbi:hypothetical protein Moror_14508 [Moniliophthora roreri MCA 2997]|uniref:Uncharacterized protein n=1 Tax=Moniliophthora roreri (strain MCA 2997) TaxID=1381753 RepID=V2XHV9_MONRO|nr:hypothetical protein Moror_14508 [Moniliophthora roreri MCA 2997]
MVALSPHTSLLSSSSITKSDYSTSVRQSVLLLEKSESSSVSGFPEAASSSSNQSSQLPPSVLPSLSRKLRHLDDLPDTLKELYKIFLNLSTIDLRRRCGAEIISLIEVAQETLTKAKLSLWKFSPCPIFFRPHKEAYFALLELLEARGTCFKVILRERWKRLVFHLSEDFEINLRSDSSARVRPCSPRAIVTQQGRRRPTNGTAPNYPEGISSAASDPHMPPPSAFPPSEGVSSLSLVPTKRKGKPLDLHEYFPEVVYTDSYLRRVRRPMSQRFGIFCPYHEGQGSR